MSIRAIWSDIRPPASESPAHSMRTRVRRSAHWLPAAAALIALVAGLGVVADNRTSAPPPLVIRTVELATVNTLPSLIDINRATPAELETLPGIGATRAQTIVELRRSQPFASMSDLVDRGVLSTSELLAIQELAAVYATSD